MCASTVRRVIGVLAILLCGATSSSQTVATSDLDTLEREAGALERLTGQPGWSVLTTPEYRHGSTAFVNATAKLVAAANERDLDAAAERYTAVTTACYQCHRYLKSARIANTEERGKP